MWRIICILEELWKKLRVGTTRWTQSPRQKVSFPNPSNKVNLRSRSSLTEKIQIVGYFCLKIVQFFFSQGSLGTTQWVGWNIVFFSAVRLVKILIFLQNFNSRATRWTSNDNLFSELSLNMAQARVLCLKQIEKVGCFEILGKYSRSIALALAVGVEKLILAGSRILIVCGQKNISKCFG